MLVYNKGKEIWKKIEKASFVISIFEDTKYISLPTLRSILTQEPEEQDDQKT